MPFFGGIDYSLEVEDASKAALTTDLDQLCKISQLLIPLIPLILTSFTLPQPPPLRPLPLLLLRVAPSGRLPPPSPTWSCMHPHSPTEAPLLPRHLGRVDCVPLQAHLLSCRHGNEFTDLPPNPAEPDLIEQKRRQNAIAAQRSRKRKLE